MNTGERIRYYREVKGITQDELANYIGVRKQTIWKYETGVITNVPLDRIEQMAKVLGVEPNDITGWKPNTEPEQEITLSDEERALLIAYRSAPAEVKEIIRKIVER